MTFTGASALFPKQLDFVFVLKKKLPQVAQQGRQLLVCVAATSRRKSRAGGSFAAGTAVTTGHTAAAYVVLFFSHNWHVAG